MDKKDSEPRRSERQSQRRSSGGSSGDDKGGTSSQGEDQGQAPATPRVKPKAQDRKKVGGAQDDHSQETANTLDAGSVGGRSAHTSPKSVKFSVSDSEKQVDTQSRSLPQLGQGESNPFLNTPEKPMGNVPSQGKPTVGSTSEHQKPQESQLPNASANPEGQHQDGARFREQILARFQNISEIEGVSTLNTQGLVQEQVSQPSTGVGGAQSLHQDALQLLQTQQQGASQLLQTQQQEAAQLLQAQQQEALRVQQQQQSLHAQRKQQALQPYQEQQAPPLHQHEQPPQSGQQQQAQPPLQSVGNAISRITEGVADDMYNLPSPWVAAYNPHFQRYTYFNPVSGIMTGNIAEVLAPVGQTYHRSSGQDFHHSDMNCGEKPEVNPANQARMNQRQGGGVVPMEVPVTATDLFHPKERQLQASALSSTVASELNMRAAQANPISDVTYVQNQLREDMLRMLVGNDLSLTGVPAWMEDPIFQQAIARNVAALRMVQGVGGGKDLNAERRVPDPTLNPPPHSSPSSSPEVRVTYYKAPPSQCEAHQSEDSRLGGGATAKKSTGEDPKNQDAVSHSSAELSTHSRGTNKHASRSGGSTGTHAFEGQTNRDPALKKPRSESKDKSSVRRDPQALNNLERCPRCGELNQHIKGDPVLHYMLCKNTQKGFTPTTDELVALKNLDLMRRRLKGVTERSAATIRAEKDEKKAIRAGTHHINSESEVSTSSEEGVQRNDDGYEDDPGDDDESPSSSPGDSRSGSSDDALSSSSEESPPPARKSTKSTRNLPTSKVPSAPSSAESTSELVQIRKQLDDFLHQSQDMKACMLELFAQVKAIKDTSRTDTVQTPSLPPHQSALRPTGGKSADLQVYQPARVGGGAVFSSSPHTFAQPPSSYSRGPVDGQEVGDQSFPEIEDVHLAVIGSFEKHKKIYKEYVSKCRDRQRTPVSLAATFTKWGEWLAVVFSEQDRQKSETEGRGTWHQYDKDDVLAMDNATFEAKYTEMCGLSMQEPSAVLEYLRVVEVDVSEGTIPQVMMAAESFRKKLKQIPARVLHATTEERVRNAFLESLFGEERAKRKRVDYGHLDDWDKLVQHLVRQAAKSATGKAFEAFKSVFNKKKTKSDRKADRGNDSDSDVDKKPKPKDKEDPLCEGVDMRVVSEQKWFKRYKYLARENRRGLENHGNSKSWKTRYMFLSDAIDRTSKRCARCRARGHVGSACDDPLPEVLWPSLTNSEEPSRSQGRGIERDGSRAQHEEYRRPLTGDRDRDRERSERRRDESRRRDGSPSRDDSNYQSRDDSNYQRRDRRDPSPYHQRRDSSPYQHQRRDPSPYSRRDPTPQQRRDDESQRGLNHERGQGYRRSPSPAVECYRCRRLGHKSSECKEQTMADGQKIVSRGESPAAARGGHGRSDGRSA